MEAFPKVMLSVSQKTLGTSGAPGCAWSCHLLPALDAPFQVRCGQEAQQQKQKGAFMLSFLILSCSLFPLHDALQPCMRIHASEFQPKLSFVFRYLKENVIYLKENVRSQNHRMLWVAKDPRYHVIPTLLPRPPSNLALSASKDGKSTTPLANLFNHC